MCINFDFNFITRIKTSEIERLEKQTQNVLNMNTIIL